MPVLRHNGRLPAAQQPATLPTQPRLLNQPCPPTCSSGPPPAAAACEAEARRRWEVRTGGARSSGVASNWEARSSSGAVANCKREEVEAAGRAQALAGSGQMINEVIPCAPAMQTCMACCPTQGSQACRPGEPLLSPHLLQALATLLLLLLVFLSISLLSSLLLLLFLLLSSLRPFHRLGGRDAWECKWQVHTAWLDRDRPRGLSDGP